MLKITLIGVGQLGAHHARILATSPNIASANLTYGASLTAIVDSKIQRAEELGKKYGVPFYPEITDEIIRNTDAAVVVTPTPSHYNIAKKFLSAGKHCFVEKPFTTTLDEADELIQLAAAKNLILQVGHIERFNPAVIAAKPYIKKPLFIETHRISTFSPRVAHIGVIMDLMIHDIDIVLYLLTRREKVDSIEAYGAKIFTEHEDIAKVRLKFAGGCICDLVASRLSPESTMRQLRVFQESSYISVDYAKRDVKVYLKALPEPKSFLDIRMLKPQIEQRDQLESELRHFIECVYKGKKPDVSGEEGRDALQLASEICRKMVFLHPKELARH